MTPLHGLQLIAAFPRVNPGSNAIADWIVVLDQGEGAPLRYVSGYVRTLTQPDWDSGYYANDLGKVIRNAIERNGWEVDPIIIH